METETCVMCGALWMMLIAVLLFWLPGIGSLIAGIVGGMQAGALGAAILASLIPSLLIGTLAFFFGATLTRLPVVGAVFGLGALMLVLMSSGMLILGAIIGGLLV